MCLYQVGQTWQLSETQASFAIFLKQILKQILAFSCLSFFPSDPCQAADGLSRRLVTCRCASKPCCQRGVCRPCCSTCTTSCCPSLGPPPLP